MKQVDIPCHVKTRPGGQAPHLIRVSGETFEVRRILEVYCLRSKWWLKTGPVQRTYYRCVISARRSRSTTVLEVYKQTDQTGSEWRIGSVAD